MAKNNGSIAIEDHPGMKITFVSWQYTDLRNRLNALLS